MGVSIANIDLFRQRCSLISEQQYLLGVRGLLVIETYLWVFLQTFLPTSLKNSENVSGPHYQVVLRKSFSVLFWNERLIYSSIILLSARTICIPFLKDPTRTSIASALFRRGIRLWFPTAAALAIVKLIFSQTGLDYIDLFRTHTSNISIATPYNIPNALAYFNSVFNLFWMTRDFFSQSGSTAFPSQTLWIVNVVYQQSYTIYMTMVIVPFTRNPWRVKAFLLFILTAWWVQSWAWYSITGLLIADMVMNMNFKAKSNRGLRIWKTRRCSSWVPYSLLIAAGLVMQFVWANIAPQSEDYELRGHGGLYYTSGLNRAFDTKQPQARVDNYLLLLGCFLFLESFDFLQMVFSNRVLRYLGSYFLMQSIIIYTAGIKLYLHLALPIPGSQYTPTDPVKVGVCFIVLLPMIALGAEIFHRLVDHPSKVLAHMAFDWIRA
ncbi:MAG: hypothetical protein M1836_002638 [Candelina mexicana]|nr:MAG: hypothetical protein M1836_002638 [Candelina mexicana]